MVNHNNSKRRSDYQPDMSESIPVFICGKGEVYIEAVIDRLKPDYEGRQLSSKPTGSCAKDDTVTKAYQSIPEASHFLSNVMKAGVVDGICYRKPAVVVMGGGFNNQDYEDLSSCSTNLQQQLVWLRPKEFQPGAPKTQAAAGPPTPDFVATRVRAGFDKYIEDIRNGDGAGKVLWY